MQIFKRGRHFHFSFTLNGKQYRISGKNMNDGKPLLSRILAEKIGEYIEVCVIDGKFPETYAEIKDQTTLDSFRPQYMEWARKNKLSAKSDNYQYSQLLAGGLAGKILKEISTSDVERYKLNRMGKVSNNTVNHELALLSNIFRIHGLLTGIKLKKPEIIKLRMQERPISIVRPDIFDAIYAAAGEHIQRFMLLMRYTGCRPSEVLRLQGKHVVNGVFVVDRTKTTRVRYIPVHQAILSIARSSGPDDYLVSYKGSPMKASALGKAIARIRKRLGIMERAFPYMLRHTFATDLLDKTDLRTIQGLLGHGSGRMTEKYTRFSSKTATDAISKIGNPRKIMDPDVEKLAQN